MVLSVGQNLHHTLVCYLAVVKVRVNSDGQSDKCAVKERVNSDSQSDKCAVKE